MLDPAIQDFLNERKEIWLKKKINNKTSDEEMAELERQASDEFSLATWLPGAAIRAKQLSLVSHPGKFSHPSAKISPIIARAERTPDGFLRTGNVNAEPDVFGNAAAMDVYKFLTIVLNDNKTVLEHLEDKTEAIKEQFTIPTMPFDAVEQGLLAIKQGDETVIKTSGKVKQIYFPVADDYHLLSIVTPSNLMYKLKERINIMRFSEAAKAVREAKRKNHHHENVLSEIYGLTVIGFGGTKPQNISVLNSQNGGAAYLLSSMPPQLEQRKTQPPKNSFFTNTLWVKSFQGDFQTFHQALQRLATEGGNNIHNRRKRDYLIRNIIYQIVDRLWTIRYIPPGWSDAERYQQLPHEQKIWLDQQYKESREENTEWLDSIKNELALWFINAYLKLIDEKEALGLGDEQISHIKAMVDECEEALL